MDESKESSHSSESNNWYNILWWAVLVFGMVQCSTVEQCARSCENPNIGILTCQCD